MLKEGVKSALNLLKKSDFLPLSEEQTVVCNILRGGLNFSLREALFEAFSWNLHKAAFISAQRMKVSQHCEDWIISENSYSKLPLDKRISIILGDVVATGTSLDFALRHLLDRLKKEGTELRSIVLFTIGGARSHQVIEKLENEILRSDPLYEGSIVVYLEGIFGVADPDTPVRIKLHGTDLLRRDGLISPLFIDSQYENPCYPLERCTIYDAGSRAFDVPEYLKDVIDYWSLVRKLALSGVTYHELLHERMPLADASRFSDISLLELAEKQLIKLEIDSS
jgi:hypoxanthine-guanine phosphoribosyltransferase